jgi:hypothetical protein
VGRFIRRHLAGLDISSLMNFLGQPAPAAPTLCDRTLKLIDSGEALFQEAIKARKLSADEKQMLNHGFWSIGLIIDPPRTGAIADQEFMARIGSSNPKYTGWPMWLDARLMSNAENQLKVVKNAFEYLIVSISPDFSNHIDFCPTRSKGRILPSPTLAG